MLLLLSNSKFLQEFGIKLQYLVYYSFSDYVEQ